MSRDNSNSVIRYILICFLIFSCGLCAATITTYAGYCRDELFSKGKGRCTGTLFAAQWRAWMTNSDYE